jgi:hypothetical protein
MTDIRANDPALDDDDRLPWLEAVEEDDAKDGPGAAKLLAFVVIGLLVIGLVVGGVFWMRSPDSGSTAPAGEPEMIAAPEGDYKVKPGDPGGMQVEGKGDTAYAASEGADPKGVIDVDAAPETPVTAVPKQQPAPAPARAAEKPQAPAPAPVPARAAAGGVTIQLGAFSSQAGANNAWKALSTRFKYLAPLTHSVVPATVGGKTLYRLRANGPDAKGLCGRPRVAGESCVEVG